MGTVLLFFCSAMTLFTIPEIYLATNIVSSIKCQGIGCSSSADCPPWHYCDPHHRVCEPCTQCTLGADAERARVAAHKNCQDPMSCIESLYARQDYACPRLKITEGHSCWGDCKPCGGTFGSYLGTTCQVKCSDGYYEVFSCIYMNEMAQWNVSSRPFWIDYETISTPQQPTTTPTTTPPPPTAASTVLHLEALVGIVAGTLLGVGIFFAIVLVVCIRRRKEPAEKPLEGIERQEEEEEIDAEAEAEAEGVEADEKERMLPNAVPVIPEKGRVNVPVETEDTFTGSTELSRSRQSLRVGRPQPMEMSDYDYECSGDQPPPPFGTSLLKPYHLTLDHQSSSQWVVNLIEDPGQLGGQPQENSAPPDESPPAAGSSDSGHPAYRWSSSNNSLQHETMYKSVADPEIECPHIPVELSYHDTSSSGYYPRCSLPDCNV